MIEAPLYAQSVAVARWLLASISPETILGERIHRDTISLLDHIVLALKDRDRSHHVQRADEALILLRIHLRLLHDLGGLEERQLVHVTGELDAVGRQIGGWSKRLAQDRRADRTAPARPRAQE